MNLIHYKTFTLKQIILACNEFRRPNLKKGLSDIKVPKDQSVEFVVELTADPLPDITWLHDNVKIEDNRMKYDIQQEELEHSLKKIRYSMVIPAGVHTDTGIYTFKATNKYGALETSCRLDVLLKPEISGLKNCESLPYKQVVFQATVLANPKPKITWLRNDTNLCNVANCDVIADIEKEHYTYAYIY